MLAWALSSLDCVEGPGGNFADFRAFERDHKAAWLIHAQGFNWYLPDATPTETCMAVHDALEDGPGPSEPIRGALYQLWLATRSKTTSEADRNAMLALYARRLGVYPELPVVSVLIGMSETREFFPSMAEVISQVTAVCGPTAKLPFAIRNALKKRQT